MNMFCHQSLHPLPVTKLMTLVIACPFLKTYRCLPQTQQHAAAISACQQYMLPLEKHSRQAKAAAAHKKCLSVTVRGDSNVP
jgi:hypothetical protein